MRRRIEVLEEENFRLIAEVDRDTGLCAAAADRITRLEADLVIARTTEANLHDHIRKLQEDFGKANAKWLKAEMALRKIAEHPHRFTVANGDCICSSAKDAHLLGESYYDVGRVDGHRCAAEIARKALSE